MLTDARGDVAVSSLGWADGGGLWVWRTSEGAATTVPLGAGKYLSLHPGAGDCFSVLHHFDGDQIEVTVHRFAEPGEAITGARVGPDGSRVTGDLSAWSNVQTHYVAYYRGPFWSDYALARVLPNDERVELQQFDWYGDAYDKGYQGVIGLVEVPGRDLVIVSVQRDSHPILYDPTAQRKVGALDLCGRGGNPTLFFRRRANELFADDYDTLVKLDPETWRVSRARRLQPAAAGTQQFIGRFSFDSEETLCTVARPFSRDVVALGPRSLRTRFRCPLDGQPLEAVALPDRSVVARDWKSGALLRGELRRSWLGA